MKKYLVLLALLFGCGQPYDYLVTQPCSPVNVNGSPQGVSGGWRDTTSHSVYTIYTSCMIQSVTFNGCQTQGNLSIIREGGIANVAINQSAIAPGCLPIGNYQCNFQPNYYANTMIVDCGVNGVFNWVRP